MSWRRLARASRCGVIARQYMTHDPTVRGHGTAPDPTLDDTVAPDPSVPSAPPIIRPPARDHEELRVVAPTNYALGDELARGGMGRIRHARDLRLHRPVAVKELLVDDRSLAERFEREILLTARLQHPSIVSIYEAGRWPSGEPFYAMRFVPGTPFGAVMAPLKKLDERLALLPNVIAIGEALAYAHSQRVIHRDLKPGNVLIGPFGETVVIDWGLAKDLTMTEDTASASPLRAGDGDLTMVGSVMGTPAYMPPEQAAGEQVDERADVYAIGAILYHVLAGSAPFGGTTAQQTLDRVIADAPPPLVGAPRDLTTIVEKAMARRPQDRYANAGELVADLKRFQTGQLVAAHSYTRVQLLRRWLRRHRAVATTVLLGIVVLAIGATWFLLRERGLREDAEHARDTARASEQATRRAFAWTLVERGQQELITRHPARAAAYLATAYPTLPDEPVVRFLVAAAMRDNERQLFSVSHDESVIAVAVSGRVLLTASLDHTAGLWDVETGARIARLDHDDRVTSAVFGSDGIVATASEDRTARVWDASGRRLATLSHPGKVTAVSFSRDGRQLATSCDDHAARIWEIPSGRLIATLTGHTAPVSSAEVSIDGSRVVTAGDRTARIWDVASGKPLVTVTHKDAVIAAQFSPDGKRVLTASHDHTSGIWDAATGERVTTLDENGFPLEVASFSPDGTRVLTASAAHVAFIRDATTGATIATLDGHTNGITSAAFDAGGARVVTTSLDGTARVWDAKTGRALAVLERGTAAVWAAAFTADGTKVVSASSDGVATVWEIGPGRLRATLAGHDKRVETARFSRDGRRVVTASPDGAARLWDVDGKQLVTYAHGAALWSAAFSPDDARIVTAGADKVAKIWDAGGRLLITLEGHTDAVLSAAFSADGQRVATASADDTAKIWEASTGRLLATLAGHTGNVGAATFSPSGDHVVTTDEGGARIFESSGRLVATLRHGGSGSTAVFSRDGTRVLTASADRTAAIWDLSGTRLAELVGHSNRVLSAAFSHDGRRVVTAGFDQTALVWDAASGAVLHRLDGHTGWVRSADFSPDDQRVVTASHDETAAVWDVATGRRLATLEGHGERVQRASFSPDGQQVLTASFDKTARLWDVHLETRTPEQIKTLVDAKVPWRIVEGRLVAP